MNYNQAKYTILDKVLANIDKCSANGDSNVVNSPWGIFKMYKSNRRGRFYSVSKSDVLHNGGSYKIGSIRTRLRSLAVCV